MQLLDSVAPTPGRIHQGQPLGKTVSFGQVPPAPESQRLLLEESLCYLGPDQAGRRLALGDQNCSRFGRVLRIVKVYYKAHNWMSVPRTSEKVLGRTVEARSFLDIRS